MKKLKKLTSKLTSKKKPPKRKVKALKVIRKILKKKVKSAQPKIAAIDIGSNAIRMVIAEHGLTGIKTLKKFRFPIRLGSDVFDKQKISTKNMKESAWIFERFHELSKNFGVTQLRAVGTSALREATNKDAYVDLVKNKSEIQIEIIDGVEEARLVYQAVRREIDLSNRRALLIDIGGGSVELTFTENEMISSTQSFPFGTVRMLELMKKRKILESGLASVIGEFLSPLSHFISLQNPKTPLDFAVGTGGNLETLGKLKSLFYPGASPTFLLLKELEFITEHITKLTTLQRVDRLGLRPDRADVIVPAAQIILTVLRHTGVNKILIPHVGLKDGVLWSLVQENLVHGPSGETD